MPVWNTERKKRISFYHKFKKWFWKLQEPEVPHLLPRPCWRRPRIWCRWTVFRPPIGEWQAGAPARHWSPSGTCLRTAALTCYWKDRRFLWKKYGYILCLVVKILPLFHDNITRLLHFPLSWSKSTVVDPNQTAPGYFNEIIPDPDPISGLLTLVSNIILSSGSKRLLLYCKQCCESEFIESGYGSGSRVLMTKNWRKENAKISRNFIA
jgi:hypothetical protein